MCLLLFTCGEEQRGGLAGDGCGLCLLLYLKVNCSITSLQRSIMQHFASQFNRDIPNHDICSVCLATNAMYLVLK